MKNVKNDDIILNKVKFWNRKNNNKKTTIFVINKNEKKFFFHFVSFFQIKSLLNDKNNFFVFLCLILI